MFKIVCAGWRCPDWIRTTLDSIAQQQRRDFEVMITYESDDPIESGYDQIARWIDQQHDSGKYHTSFRHGAANFLYGSRARYEAINALAPEDDDVIIWLNIDGDRFAHPKVLDRVWEAYWVDGFPLLTYGSFLHIPDEPNALVAKPYDNKVHVDRSYRLAPFCAADLRTMRGSVWKAIPASEQQWSPTGIHQASVVAAESFGEHCWYTKCDDFSTMIPALELVGMRHRFIEEPLMIYNILNPLSGIKVPGVADETTAHLADMRAKPRLEQLF